MKRIFLHGKNGKGKHTLVDEDDYGYLSQFQWHINNNGYAARMSTRNGKRVVICLQWEVVRVSPGFVVDHINGNRLDNRKSNLRVCSRADNNKNKIGPLKPTSSQYKGVCWRSHAKAWKAYIKLNYKQIHLGYFKDEEEAAKAYDAAALKYFGEYARLNFKEPNA